MTWTIAEIRSWYPERFAGTENDNDVVREAFDDLFRTLDGVQALRKSAYAKQEKALAELYQVKQQLQWVLNEAEEKLPVPCRP